MSTEPLIELCQRVNACQAMAGVDKCVSLLLSQGEPGCMKESLLEPSGCAFALTGRLWGSALDVEVVL